MTGLTSGRVPGDPKPWVSWGVRYATQLSPACYFEPRAGWGAENPILSSFRNDRRYASAYLAALEASADADKAIVERIARAIRLSGHACPADEASVRDHAHRVLTKVAELEGAAIAAGVKPTWCEHRVTGHYHLLPW